MARRVLVSVLLVWLLVCTWALPTASILVLNWTSTISRGNVESPIANLCCRQVEVERAKFQRLLQAHAECIRALHTAQQEVERLQRDLQHDRAPSLDGQESKKRAPPILHRKAQFYRTLLRDK